jgi:glycosyltransferase involved in cell wall biosynthesis
MRLGINARFLGARETGVQRFAREVVRRLCDTADVTLFLPPNIAAPDWPARVVRGTSTGVRWENTELPRVAADSCDVLLHPANTGAPVPIPYVCIVHDVLPLTHARWFSPAFAAWYRLHQPRLLRKAARVVTASEWSRRELCRVLRVAPGRVSVARQGLAPFDSPADEASVESVRARYDLPRDYLLFVGGGDPRKRLDFMYEVLDAWQRAGETPPPLVVVGGHTQRVHGRLSSARSRHDMRSVGHCDDATLHALYTGAAALCFPSAAEGFGRPPLEALACGTPVVAAPYETAAETIGDIAFFETMDPVAWAWRLRQIVNERRRVHCDLTRWSWDAAAHAVLNACTDATRRRVSVTAAPSEQRVALVHDWLTGMRGGEEVLEALLEMYPQADVHTLLHVPRSVSRTIEARVVQTSFVNELPLARTQYRNYLPLFPRAIESLDLTGYDLVISSSHCVAKGVIAHRTPHLCYCHTPMRYAWDRRADYGTPVTRALAGPLLARLRAWDRATAYRAHAFVANSAHVRARIRAFWGREASVVHPPVDIESFQPAPQREDYFVIAGALVPYKRVDLALEAFRSLDRRLIVVGDGTDYRRLQRLAPRNATFTGCVSRPELASLLARARALIMPMVEDFGIIAVEAQAAGTPVIALGQGGALESVIDVRADAARGTGLFFHEQTARALARAVREFDAHAFEPGALRANAARFSQAAFREGMHDAIAIMLEQHDARVAVLA